MSTVSVTALHELVCEWSAEAAAKRRTAAQGKTVYMGHSVLTPEKLNLMADELEGCADDLRLLLPVPYCNQSSPIES